MAAQAPPSDEVDHMDFRAMPALPDLAEIEAFTTSSSTSSAAPRYHHLPRTTALHECKTLQQLLEAHFFRLRNTLLLSLRLEFECAHMMNSIRPLYIGAGSAPSDRLISANGGGTGGSRGKTSEKVTDSTTGKDDYIPAAGDKSAAGDGEPDLSSISGISCDTDSEWAGFPYYPELYQDHLCFVTSSNRVLAIGMCPGGDERLDHWEVYVPSRYPSNMDYRVQLATYPVRPSLLQFHRLRGPPTWRLLLLLEALQKRDRLPLDEVLISCGLDAPPPAASSGLVWLLEPHIRNNLEAACDMLKLPSKFTNENIRESMLAACIPAFTQRLTLYRHTIATDTFPLCEIIIETLRLFSEQKILVIFPSNSDLSDFREGLRRMGVPKDAIHRISHLPPAWKLLKKDHNNLRRSRTPDHQLVAAKEDCFRIQHEAERCAKIMRDPLSYTHRWAEFLHIPAYNAENVRSSSADGAPGEEHAGAGNRSPIPPRGPKGPESSDILQGPLDTVVQSSVGTNEEAAKLGAAIYQSCREKLGKLLRQYDDAYDARVYPLSEHKMKSLDILDAQVYLCTADNLCIQMPQLSYIKPETVIVHGADRIDEASLLAALPNTTTRLILFGEERYSQEAFPQVVVDTTKHTSYPSMWSRLLAGGLPCIEAPLQAINDLSESDSDSESNCSEVPSLKVQPGGDTNSESIPEAPIMIGIDPDSDSKKHSTVQSQLNSGIEVEDDKTALEPVTEIDTASNDGKDTQGPTELVAPLGTGAEQEGPVAGDRLSTLMELFQNLGDLSDSEDTSDDDDSPLGDIDSDDNDSNSDDDGNDGSDGSDDSDDGGDDDNEDNDDNDDNDDNEDNNDSNDNNVDNPTKTVPSLESIEAWQALEQMVGLADIKERVRLLHHRAVDNLARKEKGLPPQPVPTTGIFLGPSGTGKTTAAGLYAQILHHLGFVGNASAHTVNASRLINSDNPGEVLEDSEDKVLIIDDAHALWGGSLDSTWNKHKAAINAIVADTSTKFILLVGYEDELVDMFQHVNPGLARRFPLASAFRFPSLSISQLEQTLDKKLHALGITILPDARSAALADLRHAMVSPRFGNVSEVDSLLHKAYFARDKRCMNNPDADPMVLEPGDFSKDWDRHVDAERECEKLFQDMVGCESVISELLDDTRVARRASARNLDPQSYISRHYVFAGPPGTGKTTTARRMGKVFYHMGLLASAEVVECSVTDLIGEYIGQTGPKVLNLFSSAVGKVLFIDEAYRLHEGSTSSSSYARDATAEIVGALTNPKFQQKMIIILAGYSQEMDGLLGSNPGLRSRFNRTMTFPSLEPEQCVQLLVKSMEKQGLDTSMAGLAGGESHSEACSVFASLQRAEGWGNARDVHTLSAQVFRTVLLHTDELNAPLIVAPDHVLGALKAMLKARGGRLPVNIERPAAPSDWRGREWLERRGYMLAT